MELDKIMLATDGSMPSLMATKKAVELAELTGAKIHAVTVKERAPMTPLEKMQEDIAEEEYRVVRSRGSDVAKKYGEEHAVEVTTDEVNETPVVAALLKHAREIKPDLIVLGNTGRSGMERFALGSVAESMTHHSEFPVMVTKVRDSGYLDDIVEMAKSMPAPTIAEEAEQVEQEFDYVEIEELQLGKQLVLSAAVLVAFLVPYFGLVALNAWYKELAMSDAFMGMSVAVVYIFLLFPLGWIVALIFNQYAAQFD